MTDEETHELHRITVIEMPDLSHLNNNYLCILLDYLGRCVLAGPTAYPQSAMWGSLVRLADKAAREYSAARRELQDYVSWIGQLSAQGSYVRGIDHLENCVEATHRASVYAGKLQAVGFARDARAPKPDRFRPVRDLIAHTDERIAGTSRRSKGRTPINKGDLVTLTPRERELRIGDRTLTYVELATAIETLHGLIAAVRGTDPPPPGGG